MYYRLKEKYNLRGWKLLPYAIVDSETHKAHFVDKTMFDALTLCDGSVDLDLPLISQEVHDSIKDLEEKGYIEICTAGKGLSERQRYHRYENRFMESAHWSVTGRCNCKCKHCYLSAADGRYGELSHDDVMKITEELGNAGVLSCSITGGEPLVRSDFWEIVDALSERGVYISQIYSNGLLVNEGLLERFKQRGLYPEFNMSFDGVGYHDWLRGINGAEKTVRHAFELCRDNGFPTGAEMCLWKENAHTLRDSINYLASVGCRSLKTNPVSDTGAWHEGGYAGKHGLSDDETFEIYLNYLEDYYNDLPNMHLLLGGFFAADGREPSFIYRKILKIHVCVHTHALPCTFPQKAGL